MEFEGAKSVPILKKRKKPQIIGSLMVTKTIVFLPMQLTFKGKMTCSIPKRVNFRDEFNTYRIPLTEWWEAYSVHRKLLCLIYS